MNKSMREEQIVDIPHIKKIYKSKVDTWLLLFIYGAIIIPVAPALFTEFSFAVFIIVLLIIISISALIFNIRYVIDGNILYVKCACLYIEEININRITEITPTRSLISAPAASIDRIRITYGNDAIIISPKNKNEFINVLCEKIGHNLSVKL